MGLYYTNGSPNPGQETRLNNNQQKKKYRIKQNECEKKDKYLDFARELKKC